MSTLTFTFTERNRKIITKNMERIYIHMAGLCALKLYPNLLDIHVGWLCLPLWSSISYHGLLLSHQTIQGGPATYGVYIHIKACAYVLGF